MNRLSDNDKNFGPITLAKWRKTFSAYIESGDDEDPETTVMFIAFGFAIRIQVPSWLCRPWKARWVECNWDSETVKRLGRSGYWEIHARRFGVGLHDMGNGYDFLQIFFGPQTHDSSTTKSWSKHLPWKQWRRVRHSYFDTNGNLFCERIGNKGDWFEFHRMTEKCPSVYFDFCDYDGERIIATTRIEEMQWKRGEGWFEWLSSFYSDKVRRSLDLKFSPGVGTEKGSWKGGTIGHGIDMLPGEMHEAAFRRYCEMDHEWKGRKYRLTFIGPCNPPASKETPIENADQTASSK